MSAATETVVTVKVEKTGKCPQCGRQAKRVGKFKGATFRDAMAVARPWRAASLYHEKCAPPGFHEYERALSRGDHAAARAMPIGGGKRGTP
jgi:hypothetical protein